MLGRFEIAHDSGFISRHFLVCASAPPYAVSGRKCPLPPRTATRVSLVESKIFYPGQTVLLDADVAALYEVETRALNQAVRRNRDRFPRTSRSNWREQKTKL